MLEYHLSGKVAVVAGGGGAIGGELASALGGQGIAVAVWDINSAAAAQKASEINTAGGTAIGLKCDMTAKASIASAFETTLKEFSTVNYLVSSAGGSSKLTTTSRELAFSDLRVDDMMHVFLQNYMGTVVASPLVAQQFIKNNSGAILNISSIAGLLPLTRALSY